MSTKIYKALYFTKDGEIRSKEYTDRAEAVAAAKKLETSGLPSLIACGLSHAPFNGLNLLADGERVDLPSLPKEGQKLVNDVIDDIVDPYIFSMWCEYTKLNSFYRVNITVDYIDGEREDRMILISKSGKSSFEF